MARVEHKLTHNKDDSWSARKRIPADVRDAYAKLHGKRSEEWWNSGRGISSVVVARAKHREWLSEIEARIETIRAGSTGGGKTLTPKQARALAGEWYRWFTDRHLAKLEPDHAPGWEAAHSDAYDALRAAMWGKDEDRWPEGREREPFDVWEESPKARASFRPFFADEGETAQFLHTKQLTLEPASRDMFLDFAAKDYFAALRLLIRRAQGDYSADKYAERFPAAFERATDPGLTPWMLFQQWVEEGNGVVSTRNRWRAVFVKLKEDFPSCAGITPEAAQKWARELIGPERSARTVNEVWVSAAKTVFGWAKDQQLIGQNPFTEVKIKVPRKQRTREGKWFTRDEIRMILSTTLAIKPKTKMQAAKRWVPWLCAYTGARGGEIAQLRGADCIEQEGVWAIKITPEAGTVKTKEARTVPLHEHLIAQGFLEFVKRSGGPLFYNEPRAPQRTVDPTNPSRPRFVKVRERIAGWVREVGITDREVQPNHAWRHTFIRICRRHGIRDTDLYAITGHAPTTVGESYGTPTLKDKAEALKRFPRYEIEEDTAQPQTAGAVGMVISQAE